MPAATLNDASPLHTTGAPGSLPDVLVNFCITETAWFGVQP